jgi:iron complex outermembrane receptor protein
LILTIILKKVIFKSFIFSPNSILLGLLCISGLYTIVLGYPLTESSTKASGALEGEIIDFDSGEKLGWTTVLIEELNRSVTAHSNGSFHFFRLPSGTYTLKSFRVGYQNSSKIVQIREQDTTRIVLAIKAAPISGEAVIVEADREDQTLSVLQQPVVEVSGKNLRQNLGTTIAETIEDEPGLATRTMGPAPARPVLRGLSGDRLLVLEDGARTGDLSATSSDHAVVIEPMTAERIEVIRGPEALQFGGSTLGGVVNVVRNYVPTNLVPN